MKSSDAIGLGELIFNFALLHNHYGLVCLCSNGFQRIHSKMYYDEVLNSRGLGSGCLHGIHSKMGFKTKG